jgi:phosphatidylserine decarboxylase
MGTTSGYAAFLNDSVNQQLKKVLNEWDTFLKSADSRYVLSDDPRKGWFGEYARKAKPCFAIEFECNPSKPHFSLWIQIMG